MVIHYSSHFVRGFRRLPKEIREKAIEQEGLFRQNPEDPRLHLKALKGRLKGLFSFRVTRDYRVLFSWKAEKTALFYEIGDRKFIYD